MNKVCILFFSLFLITGCSESVENVDLDGSSLVDKNVGTFNVGVPDGWLASSLYMSRSSNVVDNSITIYKNSTDLSEAMFSSPGIIINYSNVCDYTMEMYEDALVVDSFTIDDFEFEGFSSLDNGYPFTSVMADYEGGCLSLILLQDRENGTLTFDDEDVIAIIRSIKIND